MYLASVAPGLARAASVPVDVRATSCAGVDAREVERLLAIELAFVASAPVLPDVLRVDLACADGRLHIAAIDPVTLRTLARDVDLGPPEPGRDRTIALLTSQLLVTSWAESFLEAPKPAPAPLATPAHEKPAEPPPSAPGPGWELLAGGGVLWRDLQAFGEQGRLRPGLGVGALRLRLDLAYEAGSASRAGGGVPWWMASAGLGVGWRSRRWGPLAVEAVAGGSVAYAQAHGDPSSPGFSGTRAHGVAGAVSLAAGPVASIGAFRLALEPEVGFTFPALTARVQDDRGVQLGGPWLGLTLMAGAGGDP